MPSSFSVPSAKTALIKLETVFNENIFEKEEVIRNLNSYAEMKGYNVVLNVSRNPLSNILLDSDITSNFQDYLKTKKAEDTYEEGNSAINRGAPDRAITAYTKAIDLAPKYAAAYAGRGNAYYSLEKFDLAIVDYTKTIELEPSFFDAYHFRGHSYYKQNKIDLAGLDFTKAIGLKNDVADLYCDRADVYINQNKIDLALSDLNKALQINPSERRAYRLRAGIYCSQGNKSGAADDEKKVVELGGKLEAKCQQ